MSVVVELGNVSARTPAAAGLRSLPGERTTKVCLPDGYSLDEAVAAVSVAWAQWTDGTMPPAWIDSMNAGLAEALRAHFGVTDERPAHWGAKTGAR